jgi:signal transduction histidine kinase
VNYSIKKYLAYAYGNNKQFDKAFDLLQETHEQYLSQTDEETRTIINDILIKYETEKTEKELTKKQLELAKAEADLNRKNVLLVLLFAGVLFILLLYFIYRRIQHEKLAKLNFENEKNLLIALSEGEEKERFRISNDLHDGLASSIAGVKMKVELEADGENFDSVHLLNKLGELHEEVRRISHNLMPIDFEISDLSDNLAKYCRENTSDGLKIHFNASDFYPQINPQKAAVIYRVFQELLNNVRKHAKAKSCFVNLTFQAEELTLSVEDDGVGFNSQESFDGQGLNSIQKRLLIIEGAMSIESELGSGTLIIVSIKTG